MSEPSTYNEVEAIKLLVEGNPEGFQAIYNRYAFNVASVGFRFLRSKELTEDLVQDVFTSVWVNRNKFVNVESLQHYLTSMCRNRAIDYLKSIQREKVNEVEYLRTRQTSANTVENNLMDKEALEKAQKAIDKLPAMRKRVYELVIVGKLTNKEVAAQLNISEQYVLNSISVVHRTVKEHLSQQLATMLLVISYFI